MKGRVMKFKAFMRKVISNFYNPIKVHQDSKILISIIIMVTTYPLVLSMFVETFTELKMALIVYTILFLLVIWRYGQHRLEANIFIEMALDVASVFYVPTNPVAWVKMAYTIINKGKLFIKTKTDIVDL
ncbi:hypothetical protein GC096_26095 [Paenibacillus sp. LMG 31461]|uniref:Uncharacterized protein n=1 Tax=Paenibacillus plantarum TaxID=2654975 RepID=A0ABX1XGC9_9BACL|nr:hypothetical protein [Paenibacillus plantarum]NOU67518.1 hypothetical protein [Paenibacillus plantarum]